MMINVSKCSTIGRKLKIINVGCKKASEEI